MNTKFIIEGNTLVSYCGEIDAAEETVVVPRGVVHIGEDCFAGTDVRRIILTDEVETIGPRAFQDCQSLEEIVFSDGLKEIAEEAFEGSGLKGIVLPKSLESLGRFAFAHSVLVTATVPGIKRIPEGSFSFCPYLEVLNLASGVEILEACCYGCESLLHVNIPDTVMKIQHSMSRELYIKNGYHLDCFEFCDKLTLYASDEWQKAHPYLVLRLKKYLACPQEVV